MAGLLKNKAIGALRNVGSKLKGAGKKGFQGRTAKPSPASAKGSFSNLSSGKSGGKFLKRAVKPKAKHGGGR